MIVTRNYGQAGALEYWRESYRLPPVVSGHNSYWFWLPDELALDTVIAIGYREEEVRGSFARVERAGTLEHPWALENGGPIWIARAPTVSWPELRERIRSII